MHEIKNTPALETIGLSYKYPGGTEILNDINLLVPEGSIYGFLGPNGAGKTTTLKLVLGLLKGHSGEIKIFGESMPKSRMHILQKTGSLIETPSLYGHLTAMENLQALQHIYRCNASRMKQVLKLTGIANTGNKKVGKFSLGMKQRLSIAMTLLHSPKLLILDEPVNGLDPNGILEVRELLQQLNKTEGITIIISSHLLAEIEKLVSDIAIIHKGRLQFQGTLLKLLQKKQETSAVMIRTGDNASTINHLTALQYMAKSSHNHILLPGLPDHEVSNIIQWLVSKNVEVYEVTPQQNDLENIFMNMLHEVSTSTNQ